MGGRAELIDDRGAGAESDDFFRSRAFSAAMRLLPCGSIGGEPISDSDREARIRERAYKLWEEYGHPEGRDAELWQRAET